ncbi:MAG: SDR family NAD(P)-dependent oxidoreductase [Rhodospirillales bacterium]|nr:SDR family NAD(P)-dependent oxidoreductase [Rhodospirillales bacterium]MDH3968501.1 SDR family NAD(P)-dependent oxidoreductase [Rhodospirillales bacterium]
MSAAGGGAPGRLAGRIALVTGASRGLGAAVARRFAAEGARLVLVARTVGGLEEVDDALRRAGGEPATLVPLDLRDFDRIDQLGAQLYERFGRLDVLVGNAAVLGTLSPLGHVAPKTWSEVLEVNLTANWRLIRSLDPLLRQSEAGRAVFVTSGVTARAYPYWGPYAASKAALESLVRTYAAEAEKTALKVNLLDPGVLRTALRAQAFPGEDPDTLPAPETVTEAFVELAAADCTKNGDLVRAG